jgi:alpha-L-rhamnosidase
MRYLGLLLLTIGLCACSYASRDIYVVDLKCEYLHEPLGVEVLHPRLSWRLDTSSLNKRCITPKAYQIRVASSLKNLSDQMSDLWDSGEIQSPETTQIEYKADNAKSLKRCFWQVRSKDNEDSWSEWSTPSTWTFGLLSSADWKATWIGTGDNFHDVVGALPKTENTLYDPWFRKTFILNSKPIRAIASVASIGYQELYVNGERVGDSVLMPSVTDNTKRARYVSYDVTDLLKPGKNVIGIWLGTSWSIFPKFETADKPRAPLVMAQVDINLSDGSDQQVVTDTTWKTHPSPNKLIGGWNFRFYGGELYDARDEVLNWSSLDFDDVGWKYSVLFTPKVVVSSERSEPTKKVLSIQPKEIKEIAKGIYRIDFGQNFAGWIEADLSGKLGDRIDIQLSERENEEMTHGLHSAYIMGASGHGTFKNHFNYGSGRWITIKGLQYKPSLEAFRAWLVRTSYTSSAEFECSNELFNQINHITRWTFENLSLGGYVVDCPQRERMGYGGDAHATTTTALSNYALGAFYTKWAEDWRDTQVAEGLPNAGNLPYTAPTYFGGGGPIWSGYCVHLPWELYRTYADKQILKDNYKTIKNWLLFLESKSQHNMLVRWGTQWDYLGDWLWPGADMEIVANHYSGDREDTHFINNCYWIYNLDTASKIAQILGNNDDSARWMKRANEVRRAVHAKYFNSSDNSYVNGFQACLALALLTDVPPNELRASVWKRLEKQIVVNDNGHIGAGITGGAFLFKTLMQSHRDDLIYTMVNQTTYPSWGDILSKHETTMVESWEDNIKYSALHSSYLYVGAWFIQDVLGIAPDSDKPGYAHVLIRPSVLNKPDLTWAKGYYDSMHGRISVSWKREGSRFTLDLVIPAGSNASVYLPTRSAHEISENGASVSNAELIHSNETGSIIKINSGSYHFECPQDI